MFVIRASRFFFVRHDGFFHIAIARRRRVFEPSFLRIVYSEISFRRTKFIVVAGRKFVLLNLFDEIKYHGVSLRVSPLVCVHLLFSSSYVFYVACVRVWVESNGDSIGRSV